MEDKLTERGRSAIAKPAVPENQFLEVAELGEGKVGGERRLEAFLALDADAHVRFQDHAHVVAAVAHRRDSLAVRVFF